MAVGIKFLHFSFLNMQMHKAGSFSSGVAFAVFIQLWSLCLLQRASLLYPPLFCIGHHTLVNNYLSLDYDKAKNAEALNIVVQ